MDEQPQASQAQTLTIEDLQAVVDGTMQAHDDAEAQRFADVLEGVQGVSEGLRLLLDSEQSEEAPDSLVYTVRVDSSQVETAKAAIRVIATELLFLIVAVSICAGLLGWRALQSRWLHG